MTSEPHRDSIEQGEASVFPVLPSDVLDRIFTRLTQEELRDALRHKLVPAAWLPNATYYASAGAVGIQEAARRRVKVVGSISAQDYRRSIKLTSGAKLVDRATHYLQRQKPHYSASSRLTPVQGASGFLLLAIAFFTYMLSPIVLAIAISLIFSLFFLALISLRLMCLLPAREGTELERRTLTDQELPVYSVLVPLFRETSVLPQLLGALTKIDYPHDKLDIKLILEEEDIAMQRALAALVLPDFFEIIIVPAGKPQTKPRALNYALMFSRGSLLTIYDAEDVPDPQQLRIAAETFAANPPELCCLQARLTFFNADESWLTGQFTVEYASLFRVLLPTLAAEQLPLPLGGTSNHFRVKALEKAGAWDPFNVTEDADLGIRVARMGYITGTIDSDTLEEANNRPISWIKQRSRWLKGFLQTWLVHMRHPMITFSELGVGGFWVFQSVTLGVFVSALLHPILLLHAVYVLCSGNFLDENSLVSTLLAGLNMAVLLPGYAISMLLGKRALQGQGVSKWKWIVATLPIYWFMMMPAAWLALSDFILKPFHWRKTEHGHSTTLASSTQAVTEAERAVPAP
jgi:glycosyltransferase XagB